MRERHNDHHSPDRPARCFAYRVDRPDRIRANSVGHHLHRHDTSPAGGASVIRSDDALLAGRPDRIIGRSAITAPGLVVEEFGAGAAEYGSILPPVVYRRSAFAGWCRFIAWVLS